ncbi:MAG: hypothetical protein ACT4QB_06200 [Gammaproteobacteria bacterium]
MITDDVIYFAEPMFQNGIVAPAVDRVKALGVGYFSGRAIRRVNPMTPRSARAANSSTSAAARRRRMTSIRIGVSLPASRSPSRWAGA